MSWYLMNTQSGPISADSDIPLLPHGPFGSRDEAEEARRSIPQLGLIVSGPYLD